MSRSFLDRRREQLAGEGREDLAEDLEKRAAKTPEPPLEAEVSPVEGVAGIPKGADVSFADMLGASESDARSAVEVVVFVKYLLDSFDFGASPTVIATAERVISDMTPQERLEALRVATERSIKMKPVYYSKLAEWVHADLDSFYKEMVQKITGLERVFVRYFGGRRVAVAPEDAARVAAINHSDLDRMLNEATDDDVRNRGSFYQALLDRLMREI